MVVWKIPKKPSWRTLKMAKPRSWFHHGYRSRGQCSQRHGDVNHGCWNAWFCGCNCRGPAWSWCWASFLYLSGGTEWNGQRTHENHDRTNNGFVLEWEKDLELRGPGEVFGFRQSSLPQFVAGDLVANANILIAVVRPRKCGRWKTGNFYPDYQELAAKLNDPKAFLIKENHGRRRNRFQSWVLCCYWRNYKAWLGGLKQMMRIAVDAMVATMHKGNHWRGLSWLKRTSDIDSLRQRSRN